MNRGLFIIGILAIASISCKKDDPKNSSKEIISFSINTVGGTRSGTIIHDSIFVEIPYNSPLENLTTTIVISDKATISPKSGEAIDFTQPVTYTITAEDGSIRTVVVLVSRMSNSQNELISFSLVYDEWEYYIGKINPKEKTITFGYYNQEDIIRLDTFLTQIIISDSATVYPPSGQKFNHLQNEVIVTAQNGEEQIYTILFKSRQSKILSVFVEGLGNFDLTRNGQGCFNYTDASVREIYYKTILRGLHAISNCTPQITISDFATVNPASGSNVDLGVGQLYTVTSEYGNSNNYFIQVLEWPVIMPNQSCEAKLFNSFQIGTSLVTPYQSVCAIDSAELINIENGNTYKYTSDPENGLDDYPSNSMIHFYPQLPFAPEGEYELRVYLCNGEIFDTNWFVYLFQ